MIKYLFDPGHGGKDPGAVGNGLLEKDVTLYLARKAKEYLEGGYENVAVHMSRLGDTYPSLEARTDRANELGVDGLVSFHVNAGGGEGYETWIYTSVSSETKAMASAIHQEIMKVYDGKDRGIKAGNLHMVRESHMKAALLEFLFIDDKEDAALLKSTTFKNKLAKAVAVGIAKHEGLKAKVVAPDPTPTGGLYFVQVGAFGSKENAEDFAAKVRADGFATTIKYENSKYYVQCGAFGSYENAQNLANLLEKEGYDVYIKQ
jgi:N-acetylmuramoyl-L-alanine amidase